MIFRYPQPSASEITSERHFRQRRRLLTSLPFLCLPLARAGYSLSESECENRSLGLSLPPVTDKRLVAGYNNYYEFSTDKEAVRILAQALTLTPWEIRISGQVEKEHIMDLDALRRLCQVERIYRFRCVEGWSMVVPWIGVPLVDVLKRVKPLSRARYVQFKALYRPAEMIGQRRPVLNWPFTEALRIDEAVHPLTLLAVGMYGGPLLPQNGGPVRLIVPWKYGFKSIKAITEIELLEQPPVTTWQQAAPSEYGFYANVNPDVSHPRWSQRRESPLGQAKKIRTLRFNGYEEQVASLYKGMDLQTHF